jgi:Na+/melibiose symporter-like transporter
MGAFFLVIFMRILLVHIVNLFCFFSSSKAYLQKKIKNKNKNKNKKALSMHVVHLFLRFHIISFYVIDNQLPNVMR